jgi:peptidyl-prolyl cis-trans isomerase SurA
MNTCIKTLRALAVCTVALGAVAVSPVAVRPAQAANEIVVVVNRQAITSYDISRRVNFLKLQHQKGNLRQKAKEQMIEQALKLQEINRLNAAVSDAQVDASYKRFAESNKLTTAQLTNILNRAGVTPEHFKTYIRVQMSWPRVVKARYGGESNRDVVARMLEQGGKKPSTTEYILQQVIFVVPSNKRGTLGTRKREAEAMRARFRSCETTRDFAAKLRDVSVRDLGRIMQPRLPTDWKKAIENTSEGSTTPIHVTDRGVEFIAVCSARTVSDDLAAATVFQAQNEEDSASNENSEKFLAELRQKATITQR